MAPCPAGLGHGQHRVWLLLPRCPGPGLRRQGQREAQGEGPRCSAVGPALAPLLPAQHRAVGLPAPPAAPARLPHLLPPCPRGVTPTPTTTAAPSTGIQESVKSTEKGPRLPHTSQDMTAAWMTDSGLATGHG